MKNNNHALSRAYLKGWSIDGTKIFVYSLLVPREDYQLFKQESIIHVASYNKMFIRIENGEEFDDIEEYFEHEIETPSSPVLAKARNGESLSKEEIDNLVDFALLQYVRTPKFIEQSIRIYKAAATTALNDIQDKFDNIRDITEVSTREITNREDLIPKKFTVTDIPCEDGKKIVQIETIAGKQSYLWSALYILSIRERFKKHYWSLLKVHSSVTLPTSDVPVILLRYYSDNHFDYNGHWEKPGTEIIFPISPSYILYTKVGFPPKERLNLKESIMIKNHIIANAYKNVYSIKDDISIPRKRKRIVSLVEYKKEKEMWKNFQRAYEEMESEYMNNINKI